MNDEVESFGRHGVCITFPARLLFWIFLPGQNYENHLRGLYINSLKKSHYDHHQLKVVAGARPLLRLPTILFLFFFPFLNVNRFQTFFFPPTDSLFWVGTPKGVHTCVGFGWVRRWLLRGFHFFRFIRNRLVRKSTKSRTYNPIPV